MQNWATTASPPRCAVKREGSLPLDSNSINVNILHLIVFCGIQLCVSANAIANGSDSSYKDVGRLSPCVSGALATTHDAPPTTREESKNHVDWLELEVLAGNAEKAGDPNNAATFSLQAFCATMSTRDALSIREDMAAGAIERILEIGRVPIAESVLDE